MALPLPTKHHGLRNMRCNGFWILRGVLVMLIRLRQCLNGVQTLIHLRLQIMDSSISTQRFALTLLQLCINLQLLIVEREAATNFHHFAHGCGRGLRWWLVCLVVAAVALWWFEFVFCLETPTIRRLLRKCVNVRQCYILQVKFLGLILLHMTLIQNLNLIRTLLFSSTRQISALDAIEWWFRVRFQRVQVQDLPSFLSLRGVHLPDLAVINMKGVVLLTINKYATIKSRHHLRQLLSFFVRDALWPFLKDVFHTQLVVVQIRKLLKEATALVHETV